jgi:transglutaminase-like putative cysteine protease
MIRYGIRHVTRFSYDAEISESVMELRMQPASEAAQQCLQFELQVEPRARVFAYRDALGNTVHHFDLPGRHRQLSITARALVQVDSPPPLPSSLPVDAWTRVDAWAAAGEDWDFLQPSRFTEWGEPLVAFADSLGPIAARAFDPLTTVRKAMAAVHDAFEYAPQSTRVDSPIADALATRRGVCQDFTHITLAMLRRWRLPCRYVSGYISPDADPARAERSRAMSLATHAWVEVALPDLGWIGIDPTNNIDAGERHVRVAIGRDYADVPPTRGVFKGGAASELSVAVTVAPANSIPAPESPSVETSWVAKARLPVPADPGRRQQQQQQQQQ